MSQNDDPRPHYKELQGVWFAGVKKKQMSNATTYTGKIISAHSLNLSSKIESVGLPDCDVKCMRCPWGGKSSHCLTQTLLFNLRYSGINLSKDEQK